MAASTTYSWWQYSRWLYNIGRNMRVNEPTGAELVAVQTFINSIWDNDAQAGSRPWLSHTFDKKSVRESAGPKGDVAVEPTHVLIELLVAIARDMDNNVPITDSEGVLINTLIAATSNRRFGTGDTFGSVAGSLIA